MGQRDDAPEVSLEVWHRMDGDSSKVGQKKKKKRNCWGNVKVAHVAHLLQEF